jgi:hypothetical protein
MLLLQHFTLIYDDPLLIKTRIGHFACKRVPVGDDHAWLEKGRSVPHPYKLYAYLHSSY